MLDSVTHVPWSTLPQPATNDSEAVPRALKALRDSTTGEEAQSSYHRVLYAVGNNHAGTYYPVVLQIVPFLGELLTHGSVLVREATLDILVDLTGSFEPEPGFENVILHGERCSLAVALRLAIGRLDLQPGPAARDASDRRERALRKELTELVASGRRAE